VRDFGQVDLGVERVCYGICCRILWQGRVQKECLGLCVGCLSDLVISVFRTGITKCYVADIYYEFAFLCLVLMIGIQ
jgi:hypothetical protein